MNITNISLKNFLIFSFLFFFSFLNINYNFLNIAGTTNFYNIPSSNAEIESTDGIIYGLSTGNFMIGRYVRDDFDQSIDPLGHIDIFEKRKKTQEFKKYVTSYGLQVKIFGNLVKIFDLNLKQMHSLNSVLFSLLIASFAILLQKNFSFLPSFVFALAIATSPWVIAHGKDIRWITWSWYLPLWGLLFINYFFNIEKTKIFFVCLIFAFSSILLRSLFGYEYITTILMTPWVIFSFLIIKKNMTFKKKISYVSIFAIISLSGFLTSFLFQNNYYNNSNVNFENLKSRIFINIGIIDKKYLEENPCDLKSFRTFKEKKEDCIKTLNQEYQYHEADRIEVLARYFVFRNLLPYIGNLEKYISSDFKNLLREIAWHRDFEKIKNIKNYLNFQNLISMGALFLQLFIFLTIVMYSFYKVFSKGDFAEKFLLSGAFLSSISWFILAKKYAFVHIHLGFISWYLSFVPISYLLIVKYNQNEKSVK